jgi:hypothetical protein
MAANTKSAGRNKPSEKTVEQGGREKHDDAVECARCGGVDGYAIGD